LQVSKKNFNIPIYTVIYCDGKNYTFRFLISH